MIALATVIVNGIETTTYYVDYKEVLLEEYTKASEKAKAANEVVKQKERTEIKKLLDAAAEKTKNKRVEVAAKLGITVEDLLAIR